MKRLILCLCLWFSAAALASAQAIFHADFDGPNFTPGPAHGQGGWSAQFGFNSISTAQSHSGSQSFLANGAGGSHPFDGPSFEMNISYGNDFWLETWILPEIKAAAATLPAEERSALVAWLSESEDVWKIRRESLCREIQIGLDEIERGDVGPLDLAEIKRKARARFAA